MKKTLSHLIKCGFVLAKMKTIKAFYDVFHIKQKDVYLFIERGYEAQDNAWHMFNYFKEKGHKCYYIIDKKSLDCKKFDKKDLIYLNSFKHYKSICTAKCIISTHIGTFIPGDYNVYRKVGEYNFKAKIIWLQHGIIYSYHDDLKYPNLKIDMFVTSVDREYKDVQKTLGYPPTILKNTGLARFDNLPINSDKKDIKNILFMPTWRRWLTKENIKESMLYKSIKELLTNEKLIEKLRSSNAVLSFYPHYQIQTFINEFECFENDVIKIISIPQCPNFQTLLTSSDLLITDTSSVQFDFVYMNRPVCYFQPDYNEFIANHYAKGYFDFEKDGFGPILKTSEEMSNYLINAINKGSAPIDQEKIDKFFTYHDHSNKERIYNEILKLFK